MPRMLRSNSTFPALSFAAGLVGTLGFAGAAPGATPIGSEFQVDSYTTNDQRYPSVSVDADADGVISGSEFALTIGSYGGPPGPSGLACAGTVPCP